MKLHNPKNSIPVKLTLVVLSLFAGAIFIPKLFDYLGSLLGIAGPTLFVLTFLAITVVIGVAYVSYYVLTGDDLTK